MDNIDAQKDYVSMWHQLTFAELKGSLVLAYHRCHQFILDLWFLTDFETGVWVKEYSIQTGSINLGLTDDYHVKPLLVLADGRLVICVRSTGLLFICDPQTSTFTKVEMDMGQLDSVGSYTGSLLSLQGGDMV
uniref:F-box associated domain-containing protein n=1 Tax=Arundo donax TaxID=35708 RepID=A0A0A9BNW1_ARUDO